MENLNLDFDRLVAVRLGEREWVDSPSPGVQRKPLEREGREHGRATTLVRFAPGSSFSAHTHDGGEEFLVLEGVFSDETGDYPAGTYVRNPVGSRHAPSSREGCTLFVKLCQLSEGESDQTVLSIDAPGTSGAVRRGAAPVLLYEDHRERVAVRSLADGESSTLEGAEVLVLDGALALHGEEYPALSWIRIPVACPEAVEARGGARLWVKTGHLSAGDGGR